jgi:hypothetical protein
MTKRGVDAHVKKLRARAPKVPSCRRSGCIAELAGKNPDDGSAPALKSLCFAVTSRKECMHRLPGLDLLRAFAIVSVICTHAWIAGGMGYGFGWTADWT